MTKILFLLLAIIVAYLLLRGRRAGRGDASSTATARPAQRVVPCAYCRLQVPENEAVMAENRHYCCDEHRRLDGR